MKVLNEDWEWAHIGILAMAIWFVFLMLCIRHKKPKPTNVDHLFNKIEQPATKERKGN